MYYGNFPPLWNFFVFDQQSKQQHDETKSGTAETRPARGCNTNRLFGAHFDVLECINRQCPNQIQALDLHANEKMRAAGLEQTVELERLFSSSFTNLRYLRLQGGFVDNRLLSALLKGMRPPAGWSEQCTTINSKSNSRPDTPLSPPISKQQGGLAPSYATRIPDAAPRLQPCRLSQVFLGPGSVTDSAIEKLVAVAGHSLEVFRVMSCVDVGGGALATILTRCPRLRVLGVYRSLARDRDLLEGLGIELEDGFPTPPTSFPGVATSSLAPLSLATALSALANTIALPITTTTTTTTATTAPLASSFPTFTAGGEGERPTTKPKRVKIVAPLERLELGTVKLTRRGVEEILKGVSKTLRFLVLETQHLSESFLQDVVMPLGMPLEALHFNNPITVEHHHQGGAGPQGRPTARFNANTGATQN
ncbi:hypothetical protein BGZ73_009135 [Actinomortierella ambigua]|nr:hypothetical protein BGZ73_009135 [Actinomortierella ambigua]